MVSGRSVIGLKTVNFLFNSQCKNNQTPRGGKNLKKYKHTD